MYKNKYLTIKIYYIYIMECLIYVNYSKNIEIFIIKKV
jgi:hypothetical protein